MSTDAPFTPPKKKPSVFWWLGGALVLLVLIFVLQLFGPSPRIIVSPQTTYITSPLRPDGLPDYEQYVLQTSREGVTPENNAAALLWPALWPGELDPSQYADVTAELGLDAIPSQADAVVPIYKQISNWLKTQPPLSEDVDLAEQQASATLDRIFDQVTSRPWTSDQFPWLAKWVSENQKPLDKMVAASHRTKCYFPSPTMLDKQNDMLIAILLPGVQGAREAARALVARAMWHVGEKLPMEAWQDLLAIERLGRLTAQGPTIVEELVGIAIAGIADQGTVTMLHESQLSAKQARQVLRDLDSLESFSRMADSMDNMERLSFLDAVTQLSSSKFDAQELKWLGSGNGIDPLIYLHNFRIDWNIVLRKGNQWYDRYVAAARLPTFEARQQAFSQIDRDIQQLSSGLDAGTLVASILNPSARSDAVASVMIALFLPAVDAALTAQDRANSTLDLTRLAASLAVYRAEHGAYPQKLDELVPRVLDKLPVDLYHAKPFIYKRIDDGYLLYSSGENGQDDEGSSEQSNTYEGRSLDDLDESEAEPLRAKIPAGADDLSIRVPRPPLKRLPATSHSE